MGVPFFQIQDLIKKNNIQYFSSNYALYGDMSERVMAVLQSFCPDVEVYSIDEAFLKLSFPNQTELSLIDFAKIVRQTVKDWTGIPVSVGIAPTKTLAKLANHVAKKQVYTEGVFTLMAHNETILSQLPVSEIWGIGRAHETRLISQNIKTVWDLCQMPEAWARQELGGVVGVRLLKELKGFPCHDLEPPVINRQNMCVSRSFQKDICNLPDLKEAIATYATRICEKLRHFEQKAGVINVFLVRNRFKGNYTEGGYAYSTQTVELNVHSSDTAKIITAAVQIIEQLYRQGLTYKKVGIIVSDLHPAKTLQTDIFGEAHTERKREILMVTMDKLNARMGRNRVRSAACTGKHYSDWQMKAAFRSPRFTTRWGEILTV
jgi:DNA polymerase V